MTNEIEVARANTQEVYERQARRWDERRSRSLYEKSWLDKFANKLPPRGRLLDLGCGSGDPVARYFIDQGFELVGVDYSKTMIDLARERYPYASWFVQDIRTIEVHGLFDGIYSWDGFFHLSVEEQRSVIPDLVGRIASNGAMLLTVGTGEGEVLGTVGGETVYHASLSPDEYRSLLLDNGFNHVTYIAEDPTCQGRSVLLASGMANS